MPALQTVDLSPIPRTRSTPLEDTVSAFSARNRENQINRQESDALSQIYAQHRNDGDNIGNLLKTIHTRADLSPTSKVNTINQLLKYQEHNSKLQRQAMAAQASARKEANEERKLQLDEEKRQRGAAVAQDIAKQRGIEEGRAAAYQDQPALLERTTRPPPEPRKTQASQPIDKEQLAIMQQVRAQPGFGDLTSEEVYRAMTDAGVSRENAETEAELRAKAEKLKTKRGEIITAAQAKDDADFYNEQMAEIPRLQQQQQTIDAADALNEEGVTGKTWDQMMQNAGLLQFTSAGFREYASYAKEMVKNSNIKGVVGSQISAMEFGFFRDATISERFSKEANRRILQKEKLALRMQSLYSDITRNLVEDNGGKIPERLRQKVNDDFRERSKPILDEVRNLAKQYQMIQKVPKGFVLMYDEKRNPLHIPENKVKWATEKGATLQ